MGSLIFFFQAEDGIRYLVRSRGLGDVYKRQGQVCIHQCAAVAVPPVERQQAALSGAKLRRAFFQQLVDCCLLYTSDAADERSSVDLGGRRIIKKKKQPNKYFILHFNNVNHIRELDYTCYNDDLNHA